MTSDEHARRVPQDEMVLTCVDCSFHSDDVRKLRRHAKRKAHFTGQKPRREAEKTSWRKRIAVAIRQLFASPHDPPHYNSEPIGDDAWPPEALYLTEEYIDKIGLKFDGKEYKFVVEDGELDVERDDDD